jgi:hypothetical protein
MRRILRPTIGALLFVVMAKLFHVYSGLLGLAVSFGAVVALATIGVSLRRLFRRRNWKRLRELGTMRRETAAAMAGLPDAELIDAVNELFIDDRQKIKFLRRVRRIRRDGLRSGGRVGENAEDGFNHDEPIKRHQRQFGQLAIQRRRQFEGRILHTLDVANRIVLWSLAAYAAVSAIYLVWHFQ